MPFGRHQQICAEGIQFTVDPASLGAVASLLVPLRVPDLPVVLWCCNAAALGQCASTEGQATRSSAAYESLFPMADKLIFDSGAAADPDAALGFLRQLKSKGVHVADLAWTRLTGWREAIAHLFENGSIPADRIAAVDITHGGDSPASGALYLSAWMKSTLPAARVSLQGSAGEPGLRSVVLWGQGVDCSVSLADGSSVNVRASNRSYLSLLPPVTSDALMREELSILGPDPVFDRVLDSLRGKT